MKRLATIFILSTSAFAASSSESPDISQAGIQTAFRILQKEYIRSDDLTFDVLNRAALSGLLQRLDFGAELIPQKLEHVPEALSGVQSGMAAPSTAYLRPLAFTAREVSEMEQQVRRLIEAKTTHLILDLRTPAPPGDFDVAAAMLSLFVPKGEVLFKMQQMGREEASTEASHRDPVWTKRVFILIDDETNNLGETIAAVLRHRKQALLIGTSTRGGTVRYETVPVDAHWSLRFARAEVLLADDSSVFKKGLMPDFTVALERVAKHQAFEEGLKHGIQHVVTDHPRRRFNESTLVRHQNPELDVYVRRAAGEPLPEDTPKARDLVTQRAVDLISARTLFDAAKLDWGRSTNRTPPARKAIPLKP